LSNAPGSEPRAGPSTGKIHWQGDRHDPRDPGNLSTREAESYEGTQPVANQGDACDAHLVQDPTRRGLPLKRIRAKMARRVLETQEIQCVGTVRYGCDCRLGTQYRHEPTQV
jgi:hypothetical protein